MAMTGRTIIGVFDEAGMADQAINSLQNAGFSTDQIYHTGRAAAGSGFWSGLKSFFGGNDTMNESGAHVANDLEGMGVSDDEANYYENEYNNGHTVVAVRADNNAENAWSLMQTNGAYNYSSRMGGSGITNTSTTRGTGTTTDATRTGPNDYPSTDVTRTGTAGSQRTANNINNDADTSDTVMPLNTTGYDATQTQGADYTNTGTDEAQRMRLREEQLNVNKQRVQSGEVQLHKQVVEEQKTVNVPVTHEEVYVERRPATDTTADNTPIGQGEEIRVPVSQEQVNVNKNTVVTGEVAVGKRAVQENQQVSDTVRREQAHLEQDGNPRVSGTGLNNDTTMNNNTVDNTNTNTTNP